MDKIMSYELASSRAKRGDRKILRLLRHFIPRNDGVISYKAFTLAEVLITLLIIGVVASIVVPNLINDSQNAELKTAWKKSYSEVAQATAKVIMDNGGTLVGVFTNHSTMLNQFKPHISYSKFCYDSEVEGCWHKDNEWQTLNGTLRNDTYNNVGGMIVNNGMLYLVSYRSTPCTQTYGSIQRCGFIQVDVNGFKAPNTIGKDIFEIHILANSTLPAGSKDDGWICEGSTGQFAGIGCSAKYLYQ